MKVSGYTFLDAAVIYGYPFRESIKSALPVCDEFIVVIGPSEDGTVEAVTAIDDPKIRIVRSAWNHSAGMFCFGQQTNIALFNCTGDWAFYIQGDEVIHENDYELLREQLRKHLDDPEVEGLAFDYVHFYGNHNTQAWSPRWYRQEIRVTRNNIRVIFPNDAQYPILLLSNKKSRYLKAVVTGIKMYHYGWVQSDFMKTGGQKKTTTCRQVDPTTLRRFEGTHPQIMMNLLKLEITELFQTDTTHELTSREKRHRMLMLFERLTGLDFSNRHFITLKKR
jgi:glycosyltransferase involved in cell wall biosynthesis